MIDTGSHTDAPPNKEANSKYQSQQYDVVVEVIISKRSVNEWNETVTYEKQRQLNGEKEPERNRAELDRQVGGKYKRKDMK